MTYRLFTLTLALLLPLAAQAHRVWILPDATLLSGDDPWVTFDAAVSNDIFYTDHHPYALDRIEAIGPTGEPVPLQNPSTGKYRSVFDLHLESEGTYRVQSASGGLSARWEEDGEPRGWPRRGGQYSAEGFAENVPNSAENLEVRQFSRRVETFVTAGAPTREVLKPSGKGLELVPTTHPNDLYAGETAAFQLLIDGLPAAGAEVEVIPAGMRYRNTQDEITLKSDDQGQIRITWPAAGRYWVGAEYSDDQAKAPATIRAGSYVAVFEVLPQ
ncbi:DUF4198 domain-containing protein [Abyssibacter sp.]|uniref:DUF4198 domain-containing protein n=1 Tax=Abyssibacter sp. TaxID=2320200 RepID=UPI0025BCE8A1|nr:DUF4198 domain-containing protein [Abyssibacter sp.]MCK5860587.1 DUF4198 domain-containing protein [Abyssibacter sp.]